MMPDIPDGKTGTDRKTGQRVVRQGGQWVPVRTGKPQVQEASMRGRMDLGLAPMVQAEQNMSGIEARGNPYALDKNFGNAAAKVLSDTGLDIPGWGVQFHPLEGIAKHIGGPDFQAYQQAAKAFESQLMPIMSGAAVSPSEAARQIKAALPELGDSPEILQEKGRTRKMMLNGAAKARGLSLPYPDVDTWGINTNQLPSGGPPGRDQGAPRVRRYNPATGAIE